MEKALANCVSAGMLSFPKEARRGCAKWNLGLTIQPTVLFLFVSLKFFLARFQQESSGYVKTECVCSAVDKHLKVKP